MMRRVFVDIAICIPLAFVMPAVADWDIEVDDSELPAYLSIDNIGEVNVDGSPKVTEDQTPQPTQQTELNIRSDGTEALGGFQSPGNIGTEGAGISLPMGGSGTDVEESAVARDRAARRKVAQYQAVVDDLEFEYGPYHMALTEALSDLASAYEEMGDYQASHELYDRALHALRINVGLHNLEQAPILKELIDSLLDIGDVDTAIERQRYYYWIHDRAFQDERTKMLPVVSDLIEWHWWAYGQQLGEAPYEHLLDAYVLARQSEAIITSEYGDFSNELMRILHIMNIIDFQLYEMNIPVRESALRGYERGVPATAIAQPGDVFSFGSYDQQTGLAPDSFMRRGRKRFERMVEAVQSQFGEHSWEYYELLVRHSDWKLLFGKDRTAIREYEEAYQAMIANEESAAFANEMFQHVRRLPIMDDPVPPTGEEPERWQGPATAPPDDPEIPYVQVFFDVTPRGRVRNIRMGDTNLATPDSLFFRVRRDMITRLYRPRLSEGQVVASTDETRYIEFPKGSARIGRAMAMNMNESSEPDAESADEDPMTQAMVESTGEAGIAEADEE